MVLGIVIFFYLYNSLKIPIINSPLQEVIHNEQTGKIDYSILTNYSSEGGFIASTKNPVHVKLQIRVENGEDFRDLEEEGVSVFFGGGESTTYLYPLSGGNGFFGSVPGKESIDISDRIIDIETDIVFVTAGEYPPYRILIQYKDGTKYDWTSQKKILVEPPSVLIQLRNYKVSVLAIIVAIFIGFITLISFFKKPKQ